MLGSISINVYFMSKIKSYGNQSQNTNSMHLLPSWAKAFRDPVWWMGHVILDPLTTDVSNSSRFLLEWYHEGQVRNLSQGLRLINQLQARKKRFQLPRCGACGRPQQRCDEAILRLGGSYLGVWWQSLGYKQPYGTRETAYQLPCLFNTNLQKQSKIKLPILLIEYITAILEKTSTHSKFAMADKVSMSICHKLFASLLCDINTKVPPVVY